MKRNIKLKPKYNITININFYVRDKAVIPSVLTERQEFVFNYIGEYIKKNGISPSIPELKKALNVSSLRSVTQFLEILEKKHFIKRNKSQKRSIKLLK